MSIVMPGRFDSNLTAEELARVFGISGHLPNLSATRNLVPGQQAPIVHRHPGTGERRLDLYVWGLVPSWTKDLEAMRKPIEVCSETAADSGMVRDALMSRRGLVPATFFYESPTRAEPDQSFAVARADGEPLALAAIWDRWQSPDGRVVQSFAFMTTLANLEMSAIHDRMPVVLDRNSWSRWLGEDNGDVLTLLRPAPEGALRLWRCPAGSTPGQDGGMDRTPAVVEDRSELRSA